MPIHELAEVESGANLGKDVSVWHFAHIRSGASIGDNCVIGHCVFVDENVVIGDRTKIQNKASVYSGVTIGSDVFVGPHVCFTNDLVPRAFNKDWQITPTVVEDGVSIGANSTIRCGITLGSYCMIGAGALVTKDVPPFALVLGVPGQIKGRVCYCGQTISDKYDFSESSPDDKRCDKCTDLDIHYKQRN